MLKEDFIATCKINRFSDKTIRAYWGFILGYIKFNNLKHPRELVAKDVENYIKYLATE